MKIAALFWLVCGLTVAAKAANILIFLPLPLYSHTYTFMPVFKELAARGHNITMVSPYQQPASTPNWTDVVVETSHADDSTVALVINSSPHFFYPILWNFCKGSMENALTSESVQKFINGNHSHFDLLIMEPNFCQEAFIALGHKMNIPVVALHAMSLTPWYAFLTGNEVSFSLIPNIRTSYTYRMTFFERLDNFLVNLIEFSTAYFQYIPHSQRLMDKYLTYQGHESRPSMLTMLRNVSLTLMDYHFSILYPDPLQPNSIPVGGLSIKNGGELPKDLKEIMDSSNKGVIYMNMGSFLKSRHIPEGMLQKMFEAFGAIEQTVLMKYDDENIMNKPKNVVIRKWFPQPSILDHPNLRVFITHAGLHGMTEAAYFGIPVLCIPFFADQRFNSKFAEQSGFGLTIRIGDITKERVVNALQTILSNPTFKENAMKRSQIVRDRPQSAVDTAVYWIEYVLRHNGAEHLKPAKAYLSLYEILYIDIIAFLTALLTAFVLITKILMYIIRKLNATKVKTE